MVADVKLIPATILVNGPVFKVGDVVTWIDESAKLFKSPDAHERTKLIRTLSSVGIVGTQFTKRFPLLPDHQDAEYVQWLWFDSVVGHLPSSLFKLAPSAVAKSGGD